MRHEYFGLVGSLLGEKDLAKFLVLAAAAPQSLRALLAGSGSIARTATQLGKVRDAPLDASSARAFPLRITLPTAARLANEANPQAAPQLLRDAIPDLWAALNSDGAPPFALTLVDAPTDLDRQWLVEMLVGLPEVASVLFDARRPGAGKWDWPLKIGVPDTVAGRKLHDELGAARYGELYSSVLVGAGTGQVDLLLLPASLSSAVDEPLPASVVADAVLVMGRAEMEASRSVVMLKQLMSRHRGGLSGVCFVPREERVPWVQTLVRELSHNNSLPAGVFRARSSDFRRGEGGSATQGDLPAPVLMGDAGFVRSTYILDAARRMASTLKASDSMERISIDPSLLPFGSHASTDSVRGLGEALEDQLDHFHWLNESGDATRLVRLKRELEPQIGSIDTTTSPRSPPFRPREPASRGPHSGPRAEPAAAPEMAGSEGAEGTPAFEVVEPREFAMVDDLAATTPDDTAPTPIRHVQALITPLGTDPGLSTDAPITLQADCDYRLRVHVGIDQGGAVVVADRPFDESSLPPSASGHALKIVYCPLTPITTGQGAQVVAPPTQAMVHLPPSGDSTPADFALRCGENPSAFRSRLIVAHENRVLQTLLLTADRDGLPALAVENLYAPGLSSPLAGSPADIAFVINDNPQGISGLTTMVQDSVSFLEPDGLKQAIHHMRTTLSHAVVAAVGTEPALDSKESVDLMIRLAHYGVTILNEIKRYHQLGKIDSAERVQVVEAVDKAYFPVEFLYSSDEAPELDAKLCPHAAEALAGDTQQVHLACVHRKDPAFVCPAAFWGFQKCIERQASNGQREHVIAIPVTGEDRLGPFKSALVAASDRAKQEMQGPDGVTRTVQGFVGDTTAVDSWAKWKRHVAEKSPDLMVLLPHSEDSPDITGIPILEVSLDTLLSSLVTRRYVQAEGAPGRGPLMLLLGCSTMIDETPFLNFVRCFNLAGASVVVGTLSVIHGTQAALVAKRVLGEIADSQRVPARFDEVILKVRRKLLSEGHHIAFSLVTYGHGSWRI